MNEAQEAEAQNGFNIHDLEDMYLEYLSKYGVLTGKHVTRFGQELLERTSNYEIIKDGETRVYCKGSLRELFSIFHQLSQTSIDSN